MYSLRIMTHWWKQYKIVVVAIIKCRYLRFYFYLVSGLPSGVSIRLIIGWSWVRISIYIQWHRNLKVADFVPHLKKKNICRVQGTGALQICRRPMSSRLFILRGVPAHVFSSSSDHRNDEKWMTMNEKNVLILH